LRLLLELPGERAVMRVLRDEEGVALTTAVIVLAIMVAIGLATATIADTQSQLTGRERVKETAFNVGEGVLNTEVLRLSQTWPGSTSSVSGGPYPTSCSRGATDARCPDSASLAAA